MTQQKIITKKRSKSPEIAISCIYGVKICEKQRFKILIYQML